MPVAKESLNLVSSPTLRPDTRWRDSVQCQKATCSGPRGSIVASLPDHSRITNSRNQVAPRGQLRTQRTGDASSGGHWRTRRDTVAVQDREAPGSNPGPPTNFEFKIRDSGGCPEAVSHSRITDS